MASRVLRSTNKAKCLDCNTIIESKHRHDYVTCKCGNLSVDGGLDYLKRGYKNLNWEEMSKSLTIDDIPNAEIRDYFTDYADPKDIFIKKIILDDSEVKVFCTIEDKRHELTFSYDAELSGDRYIGKWSNPFSKIK